MCTIISWTEHKRYNCKPDCTGCCFCWGGLYACVICGGAEASLPTDCPGEQMHEIVENEVMRGMIDYKRNMGWVRFYKKAKEKEKL